MLRVGHRAGERGGRGVAPAVIRARGREASNLTFAPVSGENVRFTSTRGPGASARMAGALSTALPVLGLALVAGSQVTGIASAREAFTLAEKWTGRPR